MGAPTSHIAALRADYAVDCRDRLNAGSAAPRAVIGTSSLALPSTGVLATIIFGGDATASGATVTIPAPAAAATAGAGGTAALAIFTDSDGTEVYRGAVATDASGVVQLNVLGIANGDLITCGTAIYAAPV